MDLESISTYIGSEFVDTFEAADDLDSAEDFERVLIVIVMFAVLWLVGIAVIMGCTVRRKLMVPKNEKKLTELERQKKARRYLVRRQQCASTWSTTCPRCFLPYSPTSLSSDAS